MKDSPNHWHGLGVRQLGFFEKLIDQRRKRVRHSDCERKLQKTDPSFGFKIGFVIPINGFKTVFFGKALDLVRASKSRWLKRQISSLLLGMICWSIKTFTVAIVGITKRR
jgi:hypothetical protein